MNTGVGSLSLLQGIYPIGIKLESPEFLSDSLPAELPEKAMTCTKGAK